MEQPLEEILKELEAAEGRWKKLLEEAENEKELIKRPEILNIGPKPIRKLVKREVEPIVNIPKIKRNRGDFISRMKTQLNVLKTELGFTNNSEEREKIKQRIEQTKTDIKQHKKYKKNKRNGKHPNKN